MTHRPTIGPAAVTTDEERVTASFGEPVEWKADEGDRWVCDMCTGIIRDAPNRSDRRYCSNACRQKAYRERHNKRR